MKSRWLVRSLVILAALLCLGMAGYAGQVWWARRIANSTYGAICAFDEMSHGASPYCMGSQEFFTAWRACPWWGYLGENPRTGSPRWHPQRAFLEHLRSISGVNLPNAPDAWEAWFKAHPELVWDDKLKRLVDPKGEAGKP